MKTLREIIERRKEQARLEQESELKSNFMVIERDGALWLTHMGVAFAKIPSTSKAEDIAKELNKARETAVEFERL